MGEVHRAYDTGTERMVAVKVLSAEFAQDKVYRRRFQREAQLVARLHEPHIVPIHDFGEIEGRLFLEMRLVEAPNLATVLTDKGTLGPAEAVAVITQIAAALDAAHTGGVLHRDVKPSNILVTPEDFAYLIDFGIARSGQDTTLTRAGTMIGTLAYMAPERLTLDQTDARSDVYSLACVLYECLAGTKPYLGDSVERQIAAHLTDRPPLPSAAGLPPAFDAVIAQGMAKKPDERYSSAGELAAAAQQALLPPAVAPPEPRRTPRAGIAVAALVFALVSGSALALTRDGTATVTDAPAPPAPPSASATVVPGPAVAEPAPEPAPAPRLPVPEPAPHTVPRATTTIPAAPPVLPGTAVAESVPTAPTEGPAAEPQPAPPLAPPLPTTSVAAPPTTTAAPSSSTPATSTTPETTRPTTTTPTTTTPPTTTAPESTGSGEPTGSAAASGSATTEKADSQGSTIATSSASAPATPSGATPTPSTPPTPTAPTSTR